MQRPVDTLFFDLYGTLVDIRTDEQQLRAYRALASACARYGAVYPKPRDLRRLLQRQFAALNAAAKAQPGHTEPDLAPAFAFLLQNKGIAPTPQAAAWLAWVFRRGSTNRLRLYPGCAEFLRAARAAGIRCVLVSNAQSLFTRPELALLGLDELLDDSFISSEEGVKKPDARFYRAALASTGADPARTWMVGNDAACDIDGAVAAGLAGAVYFRTEISPAGDPARPANALYAFAGADYTALAQRLGLTL